MLSVSTIIQYLVTGTSVSASSSRLHTDRTVSECVPGRQNVKNLTTSMSYASTSSFYWCTIMCVCLHVWLQYAGMSLKVVRYSDDHKTRVIIFCNKCPQSISVKLKNFWSIKGHKT